MSVDAPQSRDIGQCVACGLCLPHCPTFRVTGKETASPRGRIAAMRAVVDEGAAIDDSFIRMMDECLACRACEAACPSGVPFGRLIEGARAMIEPHRPRRAQMLKRAGLGVLRHRNLLRAMAVGLAIAQALRLDRVVPRRLRIITPTVSLTELRTPLPEPAGEGPTAALLTGCVMNVAFRPVHRAALRVLAASGYRATAPAQGTCCGALAAHGGRPDLARSMARERIADFDHADVVVVNSAGCSAHMKTYGELLADDEAWRDRAERFAERVRDIAEMELQVPRRDLGAVTVHDACHHLHAQGIRTSLRDQLTAGGATCVEVRDAGRCCGAAGVYGLTQPEMSATLRRAKAVAIHEAGAPIVAVGNPGCATQIARGLEEIGSAVRVVHPAELLQP